VPGITTEHSAKCLPLLVRSKTSSEKLSCKRGCDVELTLYAESEGGRVDVKLTKVAYYYGRRGVCQLGFDKMLFPWS
jgi:hypothetical protein